MQHAYASSWTPSPFRLAGLFFRWMTCTAWRSLVFALYRAPTWGNSTPPHSSLPPAKPQGSGRASKCHHVTQLQLWVPDPAISIGGALKRRSYVVAILATPPMLDF
ncbi:hypothetical protein NDU88_001428 [Pleurodeles waltl]|uniref:Secreted protein n=1 Tax=Pleurodeles waltl TaxID=8319 RepID=A0AAV7MPW0_PLEWA|nr:hypothetical protein NDU88_001428 [Pleurodeles waltl]